MEKMPFEQRLGGSEVVIYGGAQGRGRALTGGSNVLCKGLESQRNSQHTCVTGLEGGGAGQSSKMRPDQLQILDQYKHF